MTEIELAALATLGAIVFARKSDAEPGVETDAPRVPARRPLAAPPPAE